jgi:hypothetical protein
MYEKGGKKGFVVTFRSFGTIFNLILVRPLTLDFHFSRTAAVAFHPFHSAAKKRELDEAKVSPV